MRTSDFFDKTESPYSFGDSRSFKTDLAEQLRRGPLPDHDDLEVAVPLARVVHDDLLKRGTGGGTELDDEQMRSATRALHAVVARLGIDGFKIPFRDHEGFYNYWIKEGAYGSWQGRRDLLAGIFDSLHDELGLMEDKALTSSLVQPISPHTRTGWAAVDGEISELRRHFLRATTPQDYRAVGLACVAVTEELSRQVYDSARNLRDGEREPPVANTKQRLERVVEDAAPGPDNAALRKLARSAIEYAQHVKHSTTPTRREAGIAADAVIQLANLLRRLDQDI